MRGDAYKRRPSPLPTNHLSPRQYLNAVILGQYRSDICPATPADAGLEAHACSGGRTRLPQPKALTPMGTVIAAHPERRVGFVYGFLIGRAS